MRLVSAVLFLISLNLWLDLVVQILKLLLHSVHHGLRIWWLNNAWVCFDWHAKVGSAAANHFQTLTTRIITRCTHWLVDRWVIASDAASRFWPRSLLVYVLLQFLWHLLKRLSELLRALLAISLKLWVVNCRYHGWIWLSSWHRVDHIWVGEHVPHTTCRFRSLHFNLLQIILTNS